MNRRDERRRHHRRGGPMPRHEGEHRASYRTLPAAVLVRRARTSTTSPTSPVSLWRCWTSSATNPTSKSESTGHDLSLGPGTGNRWCLRVPRHTTSRLLVPYSAV